MDFLGGLDRAIFREFLDFSQKRSLRSLLLEKIWSMTRFFPKMAGSRTGWEGYPGSVPGI